jgi:hypothetical protein
LCASRIRARTSSGNGGLVTPLASFIAFPLFATESGFSAKKPNSKRDFIQLTKFIDSLQI